jgi:hypothetical protein
MNIYYPNRDRYESGVRLLQLQHNYNTGVVVGYEKYVEENTFVCRTHALGYLLLPLCFRTQADSGS